MRALRALVPGLVLAAGLAAPARAAAPSLLVLHDASGPYGYLGAEYAVMLRNLLGHFGGTVQTKPVGAYRPGEVAAHTATFYLGTTYDEMAFWAPDDPRQAAYDAFLADTAASAGTVVWMGHNIWHLAWAWDPAWGAGGFEGRFGFAFLRLDETTGYNRVLYKGVELGKGVVRTVVPGAVVDDCSPEPDGSQDCAPALGVVSVVDPARAEVLAEAAVAGTSVRAPYVTRGGSLWYVGDVPFSYISEEDRYLAFADLLHDMVGVDHPTSHRALVRLEDVSAVTSVSGLRGAADLLERERVPFGVAVIPFYRDPLRLGRKKPPKGDGGISGSAVGDLLKRLRDRGAAIVQHGSTHQFGDLRNPFTGVSGDDFEFYRVVQNADHSLDFVGPVPGDSAPWARDRIAWGRGELDRAGLAPALGWEAPHYTASEQDYRAIRDLYPVTWARVVYYGPGAPGGRFVGQFFPYETQDAYGYRVVPENLGNVEPVAWNGYPQVLPAELVRRAAKALVVRDGFASFFFHPEYDTKLLQETVQGIKALGYRFVRPCSVAGAC